jgi:hypothetical protein
MATRSRGTRKAASRVLTQVGAELEYVVIAGIPPSNFVPDHDAEHPSNLDLVECGDLAVFPNAQEAIAKARCVNSTLLECALGQECWAIVIVRQCQGPAQRDAKPRSPK